MKRIENYAEMMGLPNADHYPLLPSIEKLRIRDRILAQYMHIPHDDIIDELKMDITILESVEEYELAQAYLDLIKDLETLDWMNE
jgi:hypothetical protein